jgi:excisionase family DNA binding protein
MFSDCGTDQSDCLSVGQAAQQLRYSPRRVRQLLVEGTLRGIKVEGGRKWLIPKQAMYRYLHFPQDVQESDVHGQFEYEHIRELHYFGRCVRERLRPYVLKELVLPDMVVNQGELWFHKPDLFRSAPPLDHAEMRVEREWGVGRYDARKHSLFECFQQHLAGHPCWSVLEQVTQCYQLQLEAWRRAHDEVLYRVKKEPVDLLLSDEDAQSIAYSLMTYAYHDGKFEFPYQRDRSEHEGQVYWHLKLGYRNIRKEDPEEFETVIENHMRLVERVPSWKEIQTFRQKDTHAWAQTEEFRRSVGTDPQLRKLLLESRCEWCP